MGLKLHREPGVVVHTLLIPTLGRQRLEELECKASLVYKTSPRTTQRNPIPKKQNKTTENNK